MRPGLVADVCLVAREVNLGFCRGQGERVQRAAHAAAERLVDHLVLLHAGLALEGARDDVGGVVVAVAGQIPDLDLWHPGTWL